MLDNYLVLCLTVLMNTTTETKTVRTLDRTADAGRTATYKGRTGRLSYAKNPSYHRIEVLHWYLIIPNPGNSPFKEVALSLQWAEDAEVILS